MKGLKSPGQLNWYNDSFLNTVAKLLGVSVEWNGKTNIAGDHVYQNNGSTMDKKNVLMEEMKTQ